MANKKITDLVEITSAANVDVLPIVDVSADVTNKIKVENLPINTATQTALDAKQATLVSGTNIKTINSTSLLGSGDISVASNWGSIGGTLSNQTDLQTALDAKQATLVSGTNIKTINSTSLLGSGDISISANPAGTAGQIQFSDGSAFAADSNLFWDNTNKRLGVGTSSPTGRIGVGNDDGIFFGSRGYLAGNLGLNGVYLRSGTGSFGVGASGNEYTFTVGGGLVGMGIGSSTPTARLQVKGSGSTSATTALLVQNSSGDNALQIRDDRVIIMAGLPNSASGLPTGALWNNSGVLNIA